MVRGFASEFAQKEIGYHWFDRFVQCYPDLRQRKLIHRQHGNNEQRPGRKRHDRHWFRWLRERPGSMPRLVGAGALVAINWLVYIWAVNHGQVVETSLGYYINPLVNMAAAKARKDVYGEKPLTLTIDEARNDGSRRWICVATSDRVASGLMSETNSEASPNCSDSASDGLTSSGLSSTAALKEDGRSARFYAVVARDTEPPQAEQVGAAVGVRIELRPQPGDKEADVKEEGAVKKFLREGVEMIREMAGSIRRTSSWSMRRRGR